MIIKVDVKVAGDDEFMRCGSGKLKERIKFIKKNSNEIIACIAELFKARYTLATKSKGRSTFGRQNSTTYRRQIGDKVESIGDSRLCRHCLPSLTVSVKKCIWLNFSW